VKYLTKGKALGVYYSREGEILESTPFSGRKI
jgi:hypothetical protein